MTANALAARSGGHKLRIGVGDGEPRSSRGRARTGRAPGRTGECASSGGIARQNEKRTFTVARRSSSMKAYATPTLRNLMKWARAPTSHAFVTLSLAIESTLV